MKNKGFTLIELLIAISIIAVLSVIGMTTYLGVQKSARDARRKADLNKINIYLETYYQSYGKYPPDSSPGYSGVAYNYLSSIAGEGWIPELITSGIATRLPLDPINNDSGAYNPGSYSYVYGNVPANGQSYDLIAQLENPNDADRCGLKKWRRAVGWQTGGDPWCVADGGTFSDQIYAADPDR